MAITSGSTPYKLLDIRRLPEELFELISTKTKVTKHIEPTQHQGKATEKELDDIKCLLSCLSLSQLDDYSTWIKLGTLLKGLGAPMILWEVMSKRSKKFKTNDCSSRWFSLPSDRFSIVTLLGMAKEGNMDMFRRNMPRLNMNLDVLEDEVYPTIEINTPSLTTKTPEAKETNPDQGKFKRLVDDFMTDDQKKSLVLRSRYGSGKTTFMQRLIKERDPKRVLFITYRQTLARDIMRNFGKLGFKSYLDGDDQSCWQSPRLIVQLDSLLKLLYNNQGVMSGEAFLLTYDMIVLDESESLLAHLDGGTMKNKEIDIWNFFDELLKHSKNMVLMDGDVSCRSLSFASSYGKMVNIDNANNEQNKVFNLICDKMKREQQLHDDIDKFYKQDKDFRICIVCQGCNQALGLEDGLKIKYPYLNIKRLIGTDSGKTKKNFMEDINKTLESVNIFIYTPVIESGVDITIKVKKLYGVLSCKSNCQRAFLQMLGRSRNVEEDRIDVANDIMFNINNNYNFWKYKEVLALNMVTVQQGLQWTVEGDKMMLS